MNEKNKSKDRRIQKTKTALHSALVSLMSEKSYESILVQHILDRANVGRSTFYMHFRDKDELLVEGLQNLREYLRQSHVARSINPAKKYERVIGFSLAMFEHVHEGRALYRSLAGGQGWIIARNQLEETIVQIMRDEARPLFKKKGSSEIPFELFIYFLGSTFMSVMTWWINKRNHIPPKEIDSLFKDLVIPTLIAHLN